MAFNSFNFWLIFPFVFFVYWIIPSRFIKARNVFLLIVSYLLYMNWNPVFALVLLGVSVVTYLGGIVLERSGITKQKTICWIFGIIGLLPLLAFKYYDFLVGNVNGLLDELNLRFCLSGLNWAIPVGISFFTFQAVGYVLDVYNKRQPAEKDFIDYLLFVSFFPQVTSGPISTAKDLMPQFKTSHVFNYDKGRDGLKLLLWGMFLKLALADRIGIYVDTVYENYIHYSGAVCFFASIMYTIQIYCDFAGYSLMAIGIAKILGFDLINNFDRPYLAASVTEFWRRWHISLTKWLTTHVYIGLGGNRCSNGRQYLNILVTFLVSGIWHGANWTFIIWGMIHGLLQIIEKYLMGDKLKSELKCRQKINTVRLCRMFVTLNLVSLAWIFFRMPTVTDAISFISNIFLNFGAFTFEPLEIVSVICMGACLPLLFAKDIRDEYFPHLFCKAPIKWLFYICVATFTLALGVLDCGQFIYVNF